MYRVMLLTALLVALPSQVVQAQPPDNYRDDPRMPEGVLGDRVRSVLNTLNLPTPEAVRRFMEEECTEGFRNFASIETHVATFEFLSRFTGGVDFHSIRTYTPDRPRETVVIIKDRNYGAWRAFRLFIDDRETYLLSGLLLDRNPGRRPIVGVDRDLAACRASSGLRNHGGVLGHGWSQAYAFDSCKTERALHLLRNRVVDLSCHSHRRCRDHECAEWRRVATSDRSRT